MDVLVVLVVGYQPAALFLFCRPSYPENCLEIIRQVVLGKDRADQLQNSLLWNSPCNLLLIPANLSGFAFSHWEFYGPVSFFSVEHISRVKFHKLAIEK